LGCEPLDPGYELFGPIPEEPGDPVANEPEDPVSDKPEPKPDPALPPAPPVPAACKYVLETTKVHRKRRTASKMLSSFMLFLPILNVTFGGFLIIK
jgi:outer membrane biosynthesis protein TonB